MADEIDNASKVEEMQRQAAIYNAMKVTGNERLTGFCQNDCGEVTQGAYCSAECRRDANARARMKR